MEGAAPHAVCLGAGGSEKLSWKPCGGCTNYERRQAPSSLGRITEFTVGHSSGGWKGPQGRGPHCPDQGLLTLALLTSWAGSSLHGGLSRVFCLAASEPLPSRLQEHL